MKKMKTPVSNYPLLETIIKQQNKTGHWDEGNFMLSFMSGLSEEQVPYELKYLHQKGWIEVWRDDSGYRVIKCLSLPIDYRGIRPQNRLF